MCSDRSSCHHIVLGRDSPFLDPAGDLALTPQWSYGQSTLEAARKTGGLVAQAIGGGDPEAADTSRVPGTRQRQCRSRRATPS